MPTTTVTTTSTTPDGVTTTTTVTSTENPVETAFVPSGAYVQCRCGQVRVDFSSRKPTHTVECCCVDCYAKNHWSCAQSGTEVPQEVRCEEGASMTKALTGAYYPNRFQVTTGKNKIKFNKIRETAGSINCVAGCCDTLLFVDLPAFYNEAVVAVFVDFCPVVNGELSPPIMRVWTKDWPDEEIAKLPPVPGLWCTGMGPDGPTWGGSGEWEAAFGVALSKFAERPVGPGDTFQSLLADAGGKIENLNLPVPARSHFSPMQSVLS